MIKIREVESTIAKKYPEGKMRCPTHLCSGQEAVAAAIGCLLKKNDYVVSTHRSHGHYLGKGGNLKKMLAEIYGKKNGCSKGHGGSMHLIDLNVNFMGSTAIVGNSLPIGAGLALTIRIENSNKVSCIFLGDGCVEEGVFHETINFCALNKLPVLFICENNLYSVYSSMSVRQPKNRSIAKMVNAMGIKSFNADGNDVLKIYNIVSRELSKIRLGFGPRFIEFDTYRWREHCGPNFDNDIGYRTKKEFLKWKKKDPVQLLRGRLVKANLLTRQADRQLIAEVANQIEDAYTFARESPYPSPKEVLEDLYA